VLRVRVGTVLQTEDGAVKGRVASLRFDFANGRRLLELRLEKGRQRSDHYASGTLEDWYATDYYDNAFRRGLVAKAINEARSPLVFGGQVLPGQRARERGVDLFNEANRLRRSQINADDHA
jgi:hypothetical protein